LFFTSRFFCRKTLNNTDSHLFNQKNNFIFIHILPFNFIIMGIFPIISNAQCTITTTPNMTVCAGNVATVNATVITAFTKYSWTTSGNGTFSDPTSLNAIYSPSATDITSGSVTLTITGSGGTCSTTTASQILTIALVPTINAGLDQTSCIGMRPLTLNATTSAGANIQWTTSGTGTFADTSTTTTTYTPTASDESTGSVVLTATATNASACLSSDNVTFTLLPSPTVNAGLDQTSCGGMGLLSLNAKISDGSNLQWITSGTGTFSNATSPTTNYLPSTSDESIGSVILTATVKNASACLSSDNVTLTFLTRLTINVGLDQTVCFGQGYIKLNATSTPGSSLKWMTPTGTGSFLNITTDTATYIPSTTDASNGNITLAAIATLGSCAQIDSATFTFLPAATVNAGPNQTICPNTVTTMSEATASNTTSYLWTTSGFGTFVNSTVLQSVYQPSPLDAAQVSIALTLTGTSSDGCVNSSYLILSFLGEAIADAGPDQHITTGSVNLSGTKNGASSTFWTTNGTGSFSNSSALATTYTPSALDVTNGIVKLTLTGNTSTCAPTMDQLILSIGNDFKLSGTITASQNQLDNGIVMLFKQLSSGLYFIKSDSVYTYKNGTYTFDHLPTGTYVIVASPIAGSNYLNTYLPTYSGGAETWNTATPISVSADVTYDLTLNAYTSANTTWNTGTDVIAGIINVSENASANARTTAASVPAAYVIVYLSDASGNKLAYTQTDANGAYSFKNVNAGTYKIMPDFVGTGLAGNTTSITVISDGNPKTKENGSMTLEERSTATTGILNSTTTSVYSYPNPTKDLISVNVTPSTGTGEIKLFNEIGSIAFQKVVSLNESTLTMNIEALPAGIYLLQLVTDAKVYTSKVIKQ
jgi:hypothetical protein